jgi:hypothetical protein
MSCLAGIDAPYDSRLGLEDSFGFERDPVAGERTVSRSVFERNGGRQLLPSLDESAVGLSQGFGQLFVYIVSNE